MFQVLKKSKISHARIGIVKTPHGEVLTPCFMPIATKGAVKNLAPDELKSLGADLILGNTYHLWLRPGLKVINKIGDLHQFMNWPGPILTDSGGYQIFSLENKIRNNLNRNKISPFTKGGLRGIFTSSVKIFDEGVEFRDPFNGKTYFLTPEKAIEIQLKLGSDIIMVLDECPPYPCTRQQAEKAVERTTKWARRCKEYFEQNKKRPLLFGIVQGSVYQDLREQSAKEIVEIGWDGYAIGGVAVGEPRQFLPKVLRWVIPLLPKDKPCYLMGLGKPEEIVEAVKMGIDLFDCVIPTREARHGRLYLWSTSLSLRGRQGVRRSHAQRSCLRQIRRRLDRSAFGGQSLRSPRSAVVAASLAMTNKRKFYETINILNSRYKNDSNPINQTNLKNYSLAYLHHLFRQNEPLALRLATLNNLNFYLSLILEIRQAIKKDKL